MIGMRNRILMVALATAGMTVGYATPAAAQATRTWVSGVGDDVNPCSRTAPCKTFAGAISKTAAGGEINCLDPGGFGAVTITKSMTISCPYTEGGALAGGNGITVNDGSSATPGTAVVVIRGLDIFGVNPPSNGVRFIRGAALHIEDSVIRRFNAAGSFGVSFQPASVSNLYITNTTITSNGSATGGGILVKPTGSGVGRVVMKNVRVQNNVGTGIFVDSTGNTGGIAVTIDDTEVSGTTGNAIRALRGSSIVAVNVYNSLIANNSGSGIVADGALTIRVGNTSITGNGFSGGSGVSILNGGQIQSYGDNRNDANAVDGAFTAPIIPKE